MKILYNKIEVYFQLYEEFAENYENIERSASFRQFYLLKLHLPYYIILLNITNY